MNNYILDKAGKKHALYDLFDSNRSRISYGNSKTGIPSINLLAGDIKKQYSGYVPEVLKDLFSGCTGTCSNTCTGCYALKTTRYIDSYIKYALNTREAKTDPEQYFYLINRELHGKKIISAVMRVHDSGDFFNFEYLQECMNFINNNPDIRFGTYTKQDKLILQYGVNNLPQNLVLSCSPWDGFADPIADLPQFIYDSGTDPEVSNLPHCPAVNKDGKKTGIQCKTCLHCYTAKRGSRWAVYPH